MKFNSALLAAALSLSLSVPVHAQSCWILYSDYNNARFLDGTGMDLECTWPRAPYGNWGVDSPHSSRYDADQFQGWVTWQHSGQAQWNSCNKPPYQRPNPSYYNYPQYYYTAQASTTGERRFANTWVELPEMTCADFAPIFSFGGMYMRLYELDDFGGGDDFAGTLSYPTINIPITCDGGYCSGDSGPVSPSSWTRSAKGPGSATGTVRMHVEMYQN